MKINENDIDWNKIFTYEGGVLSRIDPHPVTRHRCVGSINSNGHYQLKYHDCMYYLHRVIWIMHNGTIPPNTEVDHIDQDRGNNKIENLRLSTKSENLMNSKMRVNNTTGAKGVVKRPSGMYAARIDLKGKRLNLGTYRTIEEASQVVEEKREELFGEFANDTRSDKTKVIVNKVELPSSQTGHKGVRVSKGGNFSARYYENGKEKSLGTFDTLGAAVKAREAALAREPEKYIPTVDITTIAVSKLIP